MSNITAYTTWLWNEDSNSEELEALEREVRSLIRRKFELESELYVPKPRKFKEIETVAPASKASGNFENWDLSNLEMKMHINKHCGIFVTDADEMLNICFRSRIGGDSYYVCLNEAEDHFALSKYNLPPIVPEKNLSECLLTSKKDLSKFCRKVYHYILIFEDRLKQIKDVKNSNYIDSAEIFSSHSTEYVKITVTDSVENDQKLSVHLQYRPDFIYCNKISVDRPGIQEDEKAAIAERCQVFKSMPLLDALRVALFNDVDINLL
ncbi:uncharacterized protein LOC124161534 isoform X1 [Ischnura elegans]|uniref:uncharacterized protein LOC124161534 isoform X1 n=1 Tax=Ischnura elegans TaxID=197161 RepID=UPI001ED88F76|nr:uncharacterized protein LOC124161534 isoform X1 [Ischnura elegans]